MHDEILKHLIEKNGKNTYVVLWKPRGKLDLVYAPGMGVPWCSKLKLHAEQVAKEHSGMACTWKEAWDLLIKENPQFEKNLGELVMNRIHAVNASRTNLKSQNERTILDNHGRSTGK